MPLTTDLLANERTFLAYLRTSLALQLAGLAVLQFLDVAHSVLRPSLAIVLVAVGSYTGLAGYRRFRENERSIRAAQDVGELGFPPRFLTWIVAVVPLAAAVVIVLT
jgi:putative membrane protein